MLFLVCPIDQRSVGAVAILLGYSVEALEVDTKSKQAIFFPDEEDWGSTWGARGTNEPCSEVLINELTKSCKFLLGQGVNGTKRWGRSFIQGNLEIVLRVVLGLHQ